MQRISVVAAASDTKFLQDLRSRTAPQRDIRFAAEAHDGAQLLRTVREVQPDVLLLDEGISCGDEASGASPLLHVVHQNSPRTRIILLCDECTERAVARAFQQGARGCVNPGAPGSDLTRAIRAVRDGEVWIGRKVLALVLDDLLSRLERTDYVAAKWADLLSARELDIANGVRMGLTNKEIARRLRISDTTVKTHLENIFQKLNVSRRVQLALLPRSTTERSEPEDVADPTMDDNRERAPAP